MHVQIIANACSKDSPSNLSYLQHLASHPHEFFVEIRPILRKLIPPFLLAIFGVCVFFSNYYIQLATKTHASWGAMSQFILQLVVSKLQRWSGHWASWIIHGGPQKNGAPSLDGGKWLDGFGWVWGLGGWGWREEPKQHWSSLVKSCEMSCHGGIICTQCGMMLLLVHVWARIGWLIWLSADSLVKKNIMGPLCLLWKHPLVLLVAQALQIHELLEGFPSFSYAKVFCLSTAAAAIRETCPHIHKTDICT